MGTIEAVLAASFFCTAEKEGGKGSSRASFANEEGTTSCMGYTRVSTGFQVINNPCLYQGYRHLLGTPGHQRLLAVKWSSTILRLYQVISDSLFIPGRRKLFTPVAAVWGALLRPVHSRGAIPGPFAYVAPGRARSTPMGRFWAASFLQPPVSGMSTMVGGCSAWCRTAASGRAASISSHVSGRAARGSW